MNKVIVTVKRKGEAQVRDLEVPVETTTEELVQQVTSALGWGGSYEIYAVPPDRVLDPHATLFQSEVWDGAWLVFQPSGSAPMQSAPHAVKPKPTPASTPSSGPVSGWRPLDITPPPASPEEAPPSQSSDGFTWKRLDKD
jgi:hypothetical protein